MTVRPLFFSYMNKYIVSESRATVLSFVSMARSVTAAVLNVIFGYFVDIDTSKTLFVIGVIVLVFAFASRVKDEHLKD